VSEPRPRLTAPLAACEVVYAPDEPAALLTQTPFVGRAAELQRLQQKLQDMRGGRGGLVMLAGEPGIGKTRTAEEFAERARYAGVTVLWGRCYEGDWAPPYRPFAEALAAYGAEADRESLRADLGPGAAPLARLVPALREKLPDIPEPASLQPNEERFRLFDGVSQFLIALSARAPLLLVLDDLHWADKGTIALLRHVARFAARQRLLLLGSYRDVEVETTSALADALRALPRETASEHLKLAGLDVHEVEQLLETIADRGVSDAFVSALQKETSGNPFFIREVLLQLVSENKSTHHDGRWASALPIENMKIPEGVRQVIGRRLSRLSGETKRLLSAGAGFNGLFRFDIAAAVAGLDEAHGLSAVDEALHAQMLRPGSTPDTYDFTHTLIRHTLYAQLSPSRQVRLHRQIAETMERVYDDRVGEHAAEVAYQHLCSGALSGTQRGVACALVAADRAEAVESKCPSRRDPRRLAYELGSAFAQRRQLEELFPFAVAKCREILRAEGVGVLFLDRQRNELYFPYVADEDPMVAARLLEVRFPADRGIAGTVLRLGTALRIDDVSADPRFFGGVDEQTRRATRALLCVPFTSPRGVSGVIEVVNPRSREVFSDDDLALLDALAQSLANVLDNLESTCQHAGNGDDGCAPAGDVFRKDGDYWTIVFGGRTVRLKDAKGLHYIAHLLRHPDREFHARGLMALVGDPAGDSAQRSLAMNDGQLIPCPDLGNAGVLLDAQAKADYKRRLDDLREELEETERFNDPGRAGRARAEMAFITNQLANAIGLGGRDRLAASEAERARVAVTKRIKAALAKIRDANPTLAQHLTAAITTGYFCSYAPKADSPTSWSLE